MNTQKFEKKFAKKKTKQEENELEAIVAKHSKTYYCLQKSLI